MKEISVKENITYIDHRGNELPNHDGSMIEIKDEGYLFFDINGKGFIHNGPVIEFPDGRKQFFLHNSRALIYDGSPIELLDGKMQYFDYDSIPLWTIDEKILAPLFTKQRNIFFENRISYINKQTPLKTNEIEELRLALLAAEHPENIQQGIIRVNLEETQQIKVDPISQETAGYLGLLKGFWCQIWKDFQSRHRETLSARFTLEQYKKDQCRLANASLSESILADELKYEFDN